MEPSDTDTFTGFFVVDLFVSYLPVVHQISVFPSPNWYGW